MHIHVNIYITSGMYEYFCRQLAPVRVMHVCVLCWRPTSCKNSFKILSYKRIFILSLKNFPFYSINCDKSVRWDGYKWNLRRALIGKKVNIYLKSVNVLHSRHITCLEEKSEKGGEGTIIFKERKAKSAIICIKTK